jgi:hypothetical protein
MIDAPYAWGCSTGGVTTPVGVIDHGIRKPLDLEANLSAASYALSLTDTATHATLVSGVLAAKAMLVLCPQDGSAPRCSADNLRPGHT